MNDESLTTILSRECLAGRVRRIARSVTAIYDQALADQGVTIAQVNLLAAIGELGPCTPGKLATVLQLERSTASRNLTLLIAEGWVAPVVSDGKGVREVRLTKAGSKKIEALMPAWRSAQEQASRLLGERGVKAIREVARTVRLSAEA